MTQQLTYVLAGIIPRLICFIHRCLLPTDYISMLRQTYTDWNGNRLTLQIRSLPLNILCLGSVFQKYVHTKNKLIGIFPPTQGQQWNIFYCIAIWQLHLCSWSINKHKTIHNTVDSMNNLFKFSHNVKTNYQKLIKK